MHYKYMNRIWISLMAMFIMLVVYIQMLFSMVMVAVETNVAEEVEEVKAVEEAEEVEEVVEEAEVIEEGEVEEIVELSAKIDIPAEKTVVKLEPEIKVESSATTPSEPVECAVTDEEVTEVDQHDVELLACVIYQEAGADACCDDCRRRVADIVLNRVADDRFPDTIEEVLTQKGQYGKFSKTGVVWPKRAGNAYEAHAVERAYRIAEEVLSGQHSEVYGQGYIWQARFIQGEDNIYCCNHYYGR